MSYEALINAGSWYLRMVPEADEKKEGLNLPQNNLSITRSRKRIKRNKIVLRHVNESRLSRQADWRWSDRLIIAYRLWVQGKFSRSRKTRD